MIIAKVICSYFVIDMKRSKENIRFGNVASMSLKDFSTLIDEK